MSENNNIKIRDLGLFLDVVKTAAKIVDSAKFELSQNGVEIYGCNTIPARCQLTTNAIWSIESTSFCIANLNMFAKILSTVKDVHNDDYLGLNIELKPPFLKFSSKKIKTKINLIDESAISQWISKKVTAELKPVFQFNTTTELIRRINSHTFVAGDNVKDLRLIFETKDDMEKNAVFCTIKNVDSELTNEMTLNSGLVTSGKIPEGRSIIIDVDRLSLFNALNSQQITISLMDMNVLVSKAQLVGKNDSWFNFMSLCSPLKG